MKTHAFCFLLFSVATLLIGGPLLAHHGRGDVFDMANPITLKGKVSEVSWRNPHVVIYMDVEGDDGNVVTWAFENAGVSQMAAKGYHRNTLRVGQEITAIVNPARSGAPTSLIVKVILTDGTEVMSREAD